MAELHSDIYFKHNKPEVMSSLEAMFHEINGDPMQFSSLSESINPINGQRLANELIGFVSNPEYDLCSESLEKAEGYSIGHFVHGSGGDDIVGEIVKFLYSLCPEIHAQAWGHGDDDPWEYWFKLENGVVIRKDDEPTLNLSSDRRIVDTIYAWWHESLPEGIKAGLIDHDVEENHSATDSTIDLTGKHIVFTGKMENGNREEMEKSAVEQGAIVQKTVNSKTQLLVVGKNPGASKLNKAEELDLKIVSEISFNFALSSSSSEPTEAPVKRFEKPQFRRSLPKRSQTIRKAKRRWR